MGDMHDQIRCFSSSIPVSIWYGQNVSWIEVTWPDLGQLLDRFIGKLATHATSVDLRMVVRCQTPYAHWDLGKTPWHRKVPLTPEKSPAATDRTRGKPASGYPCSPLGQGSPCPSPPPARSGKQSPTPLQQVPYRNSERQRVVVAEPP